MNAYFVGNKFPHTIPTNYCGAIGEFLRPNGSELVIALPQIKKSELNAVNGGEASVTIHVDQDTGGILFLWQFKTTEEHLIFETSFNAVIVGDIEIPDYSDGERLTIRVPIVDSNTGVIAGLRLFTLHPETTKKFINAVKAQLADTSFSEERFTKWALSLHEFSLEDMVKKYPEALPVGV